MRYRTTASLRAEPVKVLQGEECADAGQEPIGFRHMMQHVQDYIRGNESTDGLCETFAKKAVDLKAQ